MDSDLQYSRDIISQLIEKWREAGAEGAYTIRITRAREARAKL